MQLGTQIANCHLNTFFASTSCTGREKKNQNHHTQNPKQQQKTHKTTNWGKFSKDEEATFPERRGGKRKTKLFQSPLRIN